MLNKFFFITLLLNFLLLASQNYSFTYYVDFVSGNDSNTGISINSPFKHCPGDQNATAISLSTILVAGDVVYFKAGVDYKGQVIVSQNGNPNSYISFRGQGWGQGRATFNMENTRDFAFKSNKKYLSFKGFNFYNYANYGNSVITSLPGASNWVLDSCTFAFIEGWDNILLYPENPVMFITNAFHDLLLVNCEFFANGETTLRLRNASNIKISNCDFGGINRGNATGFFSVAIRGESNLSNLTIQDNRFHDGWQYGGDQIPEINHSPDWIHIYGSSINPQEHPNNIIIERNLFYNNKKFLTGSGTGIMSISTNVTTVHIRNNLFVNSCETFGASVSLSHGANFIYVSNNTFVGRDYFDTDGQLVNLQIYCKSLGVAAAGDSIFVKNNIFINDDSRIASCCIGLNGSGFNGVIDYNTYWRPNINYVNEYASSIRSWNYWTNILGYDQNSHFDNDGTNIFNNFPLLPENSSQGDYSLNPDFASDQLNNGISLTGFNDSFYGVTRPQGIGWDIGAFESIENSGSNYLFVDEGWNCISIPKFIPDMSVNNLLPTAISPIYSFTGNNYKAINTLQNGKGYLVQFAYPQYIFIDGDSVNSPIQVSEGWNLIGPFDKSIIISEIVSTPAGIISSDFFEFNGRQFLKSNKLKPGKGYWIKTSSDGIINIYSASLAKTVLENEIVTLDYKNFGKIKITDSDDNCLILFATTDDETELAGYELPPAPPRGIFDVRYGSGKSVEELNSLKDILISSAKYPITIRVEGISIRVSAKFNSELLNNDLEDGKDLRITNNDITFIEVIAKKHETIPVTFQLNRNYPNPFNPSTRISWQSPVSSWQTLKVYDILGNEVATLVNEYKPAGSYEVEFKSTVGNRQLANGVYFYRLQAGDYVETKKMILLK